MLCAQSFCFNNCIIQVLCLTKFSWIEPKNGFSHCIQPSSAVQILGICLSCFSNQISRTKRQEILTAYFPLATNRFLRKHKYLCVIMLLSDLGEDENQVKLKCLNSCQIMSVSNVQPNWPNIPRARHFINISSGDRMTYPAVKFTQSALGVNKNIRGFCSVWEKEQYSLKKFELCTQLCIIWEAGVQWRMCRFSVVRWNTLPTCTQAMICLSRYDHQKAQKNLNTHTTNQIPCWTLWTWQGCYRVISWNQQREWLPIWAWWVI